MRQAWRWAGMKAELLHLSAAGFTGEARYWMEQKVEGPELRRELLPVMVAENGLGAKVERGG